MKSLPAMAALGWLDIAAVGWFFAWWVGYARYHKLRSRRVPSLMGIVRDYRREWMAQMLQRDARIVDASIVANLSNSSTFFASTTLLILGGLLALLGTKEKLASVVEDLPFRTQTSDQLWELKILLLIVIFIYAFFMFTWSLRQFNFVGILVGAAPKPGSSAKEFDAFVARAARLASLAGDSFNYGLRAYYFALGGMTWFVHPGLLLVATVLVVLVLYWREFRSDTLRALTR